MTTSQHHQVCATCWKDLTFLQQPCCPVCGHPHPFSPIPHADKTSLLCGRCLTRLPPFQKGLSIFAYEGLIRKLIVRFKHAQGTHLAPLFSKWLYLGARNMLKECDLILPVPLHRRKLFTRGYNQATLLARGISALSQCPYNPFIIKKIRFTLSQQGQKRSERLRNVQGSFKVEQHNIPQVAGKVVCLLDDVWTTGATLEACSWALKEAGVKQINVLTLARVVTL